MKNNSLKLKFLLLLTIPALSISCKKDSSNTEKKPQKLNQTNYPNTLNNKTVFSGYTYGKPKTQPLKTYYQKNHYQTEPLSTQNSPEITTGVATGLFHYELVNSKTGKAKLILYANNSDQLTQSQANKIITIKFKSPNMATFTEKDSDTGEISGGILTFSSNPGISN